MDKQNKPRSEFMWASVRPNNEISYVNWYANSARKEISDLTGKTWKSLYRAGWRCIKVRVAPVERTHLIRKIATLFDAIKHGDEKHQAWLRNAIDQHFGEE